MAEGPTITLLSAVTAANGAPSGASAGVAVPGSHSISEYGDLLLEMSRTSGAATFSFNLYGYHSTRTAWYGRIVETGTISLAADAKETWRISGFDRFSRYYLELVAVSGTGAKVTSYLAFGPEA